MTKFDEYVCYFAENHTIKETITMLSNHIDYLNYVKYNHTLTRIDNDNKKIAHLTAMRTFLILLSKETNYINGFKNIYFGE